MVAELESTLVNPQRLADGGAATPDGGHGPDAAATPVPGRGPDVAASLDRGHGPDAAATPVPGRRGAGPDQPDSVDGTDIAATPDAAETCAPSLLAAPLGEEEAGALAQLLSALADPVRLRLVSLVAERGELCSCDLEAPLGRSQPTISHHTRVLADAGLLQAERRGRWVWWRVVPDRLAEARRALGG